MIYLSNRQLSNIIVVNNAQKYFQEKSRTHEDNILYEEVFIIKLLLSLSIYYIDIFLVVHEKLRVKIEL